MKRQLRATAIAAALLGSLACAHLGHKPPDADESGAPAESAVAATVDGQPISIGEIDEHIKEQLFNDATSDRNPATLYDVRSRALQGMIDERLVAKAAAADNLSTDDYLNQQVDALGEVPEEEIAKFYNDNVNKMGGNDLDAMRDRIRAYLRERRVTTVVADLREQSDTKILLQPSRFDVEAIGPSKGPDDAVVTIIEFSDFQCPFCQRVVPTLDQVVAKYPTQVRFVYRNLPLANIHPRAQAAAEAAACAGKQGSFWDYHDLIFADNHALSDADLEKHASDLGLDMDAFRQCVKNRETQQAVEADLAVAQSLEIAGTPSFFINGIPLHGAQSLEAFSKIIDEEIARKAAETPTATN
jgi:protein-disulfide isomerase